MNLVCVGRNGRLDSDSDGEVFVVRIGRIRRNTEEETTNRIVLYFFYVREGELNKGNIR